MPGGFESENTSHCNYSILYSPLSIYISSIIPGLVEYMVSVSPDTLSLEDLGEAQVLRHLVFGDDIVGTFGLAHDEFADLGEYISKIVLHMSEV